MAVEDFTTYTEVDPNNHISLVGTNHIDHDSYENEDAYLYKDKGAGHFTDFEHLIDVRVVSFSATTLQAVHWMLSNAVDDEIGLRNADETHLWINLYQATAGSYRMVVHEWYNGSAYYQTYSGIVLNTWYFLRIKKAGTAFTVRCWTNETDRDNNDTGAASYMGEKSLTLHADHDFQYVFACATGNDGDNKHADIDVEDLDLQEAPPPAVAGAKPQTLVLTL